GAGLAFGWRIIGGDHVVAVLPPLLRLLLLLLFLGVGRHGRHGGSNDGGSDPLRRSQWARKFLQRGTRLMGWIGIPVKVCDPFRVDHWRRCSIRGFRLRSTPGYRIRPFQGRGSTGGDPRARLTAPAKIFGNFHIKMLDGIFLVLYHLKVVGLSKS